MLSLIVAGKPVLKKNPIGFFLATRHLHQYQ